MAEAACLVSVVLDREQIPGLATHGMAGVLRAHTFVPSFYAEGVDVLLREFNPKVTTGRKEMRSQLDKAIPLAMNLPGLQERVGQCYAKLSQEDTVQTMQFLSCKLQAQQEFNERFSHDHAKERAGYKLLVEREHAACLLECEMLIRYLAANKENKGRNAWLDVMASQCEEFKESYADIKHCLVEGRLVYDLS
eukprot:265611-Hanusia_phi.AAC.1